MEYDHVYVNMIAQNAKNYDPIEGEIRYSYL